MTMPPSSTEIEELVGRLQRFPLWTEVPLEALSALCAAAQLQSVPHRRPLFLADQPGEGLYIVRRGEFKVTLISAEGREQILYLADSGRMITEAYSPRASQTHCSAFARESSEAWLLPGAALQAVMRDCPKLALALQQSLVFRCNRHIDLVFQLSLLSVERRLAAFILELARRNHAPGSPFVLSRDINVSTVACLLGTVREEVTRAQTRLQKKGIVEINRREVIVHDIEALEQIVTE